MLWWDEANWIKGRLPNIHPRIHPSSTSLKAFKEKKSFAEYSIFIFKYHHNIIYKVEFTKISFVAYIDECLLIDIFGFNLKVFFFHPAIHWSSIHIILSSYIQKVCISFAYIDEKLFELSTEVLLLIERYLVGN